ncbi:MAG: 2-succinyl-5-enolpyruvyl-6-hydroxy-3-cyclohexene-1-carboxylic-acid synthase [Pseudobdellovibrio sp.]
MTNYDLSKQVFSFLRYAGVQKVVVCAGARNAPMVLALESEKFEVYNFFEERSAAFFALGLIKAFKRPVAVLTTSGTAAAELLPATIEAHYQGLPLILVTADRPKSYRGTGSPQTIEQVGLFKNYVEAEHDLDVETQLFNFKWSVRRPIHLNVSFAEPLIDKEGPYKTPVTLTKINIENELSIAKFKGVRPLVILSEIEPHHLDNVVDFLVGLHAPVYAESLSLLRHHPRLEPFLIKSSDSFVKHIFQQEYCDSVIRIGNVPTLRFWRDLEEEFSDVPVINYTDQPFTGLSRKTIAIEIEMLNPFQQFPIDVLSLIKKLDAGLQISKEKLLSKYPLSEPALVNKLSKIISRDALYIGNSLPIRHWDQFAKADSHSICANRGANGIDGQVSTYLGWSENMDKSYCLVGDLTALYDLAALGLTPQLKTNKRFLVVMNNFGGHIFKRVFKNDRFVNPHKIHFYHWAKMWNWSYLQIQTLEDFNKINTFNTPNVMLEILPDEKQTSEFWDEWDTLCKNIE